jgi:hypothetical protein
MAAARSLAALATLFALAACGGGGDSGTPAPPPPASNSSATLSVTLAGGASPGVDHLWVTVTGLAMHADAARVYGDGDPGWVVLQLPAPITVDLAAATLSQGQSVALLKQPVSALGTYHQLRLLLASSDPSAVLQASAREAGLAWNAQVQYTDGTGQHTVPLEIPGGSGLRTLAGFTLSGDTTTPLAIEWNAHSSLVRRAAAGGGLRFALRDELELYNQQLLTALGGDKLQIGDALFDSVAGQLATTQFCTGADQSNCIHDVVASATSLSADGRFHREVRSVDVGADGSFLLYPLPSDTFYDVVIHGANMQTIVVRNVFVDPTALLKPFPTSLSSTATPIVPVLDTSGRSVTVTNALAPGGSRAVFGFTIPGSGTAASGGDHPYVLAYAAADPATGLLLDPVALPGGPVQDALFDTKTDGFGTPPAFIAVTPTEGVGGWTAWSEGTLAFGASATTLVAPGASSVALAQPQRLDGFTDGSLVVSLAGTPANGADRAELVVFDDGGTVAAVDVSSQLAAHGGSVTIGVPSGQSASAPGAGIYGVALRTWQAAAETTSARWARTAAPVSLAAAASASVSLSFP